MALAGASLAATVPVGAQTFPTRPIELVVPFAPGGLVDVMGRLVGEPLGKELGQPIVIRNLAGAGGSIAYSRVSRSTADGYTLGLVGGGLFINSVLRPGSGLDSVKSFRPIGLLGQQPFVLFVNPVRFDVKTVAEAFERIRQNPEKFTYSSGGIGAASHVLTEYLKNAHELKMLHVPYAGQGPAVNAVLTGEVDMTLQTVAGAEDLLRTGRLRPLAATGANRLKLFPNIPTFAEAGVQGMDIVGWSGLVAPAGLPQPVANRLIQAFGTTMDQPELQRALEARGVDVKLMSDQEFARLMQKDKAFWERAISVGKIKTE